MSIIIRLQNLPWSANAENIRQFFGNLVIPDGGVHIVGGEHGDAFIAFGSDEDARQAMAKDGGDIKGVKVRLLLSSRVEMQKVIDTARQQALNSQNLLQTLQQHQFDPSAAAMPVTIPPNLLSVLPGLVNLPGMGSLPMIPNMPTLPNLPAMPGMPAGLAQMPFPMPVTSAATPVTANNKPTSAPALPTQPRTTTNAEPADKKKENVPQSRIQKSSKSRSRSRSSSRSRDRRGYRDKYRSRDGRSSERKYRRDRSKSRDRDKKSDRSRSRDRYRRRSRSRERRNDDRSRDYRNRSKERRRDSDRNSTKKDSNAVEAAANATKAPFKATGFNSAANVPLPIGKPNDIKIPGLGDKSFTNNASATPPMTAAAKSSPIVDPAKSAADSKATWPVSMVPPTAPSWATGIPGLAEGKSPAEAAKSASSSASTPAVTSAAMPHMPSMPGMPTMPNMSAMGASMSNMASMPFNMAAAYSMAYGGAPNMYGMNRFPLTAQQAAAMYPGYPMSMMAQPGYGQYQPTASPAAAAEPKPAAQQSVDVEPAHIQDEPNNGDEEEEEEVDCFGRVRKKSRRPSYSPEKVNNSYENGDRYDRRDSYRSRGNNSYGKSYHRDSYNHDDNRFHRGGQDDGGYRKPPFRRNFDRHDGGGDERPRGGFDRRNENSGDRRNFQSRFDGGGDERNVAPYDNRNEQPAGRHSKFDEAPFERGADHRRNPSRFENRDGNLERPDRAFKQSRFDEPQRNAVEDSADEGQIFQTCVEVRNIAPGVTEQDIKRFFEPLPLFDSCIKFQYKQHPDGSRSTSILVKFVNVGQRAQALQLSGKFLKGERTLILECDQQTFEKSEDMAVQLQQPYLKLAFVPKRATPDDIANAFTLPPDEVVIVQQNGKESLEAFLKFGDTQPAVEALKNKDKVRICGSRVKLSAIAEAEFDAAKKTAQASGPPPSLETPSANYVVENVPDESQSNNVPASAVQSDRVSGQPVVESHNAPTNGSVTANPAAPNELTNAPALTCIRFNALPLNVTDRDIVKFLKDVEVHPRRIHMMYTPEGTMSGEAFCEFSDEASVHGALQKDRCLLNNHIVEMTPISMEDLMAAVNDVPAYDDLSQFEDDPAQYEQPMDGSQMYQGFGGRGSRPYMGRGPRRPFGGPRGQYGEARGGRRPPGPSGPVGQAVPDQFGRPRCVVSLENVPYKANVEDIMHFFGEFNVSRSDVIRRYNENNLATGDARVSLRSPAEAMRAANTLDGQTIFDRFISVRYMR